MFKRTLIASLALGLAGCMAGNGSSSSSKSSAPASSIRPSSAVTVSSLPPSSIRSSSSVAVSSVVVVPPSSSSIALISSSSIVRSSSSSIAPASSSAPRSSSSAAQSSAAPAGCAPLVQTGQSLYASKNCVGCHGAVGANGVTAGGTPGGVITPTDKSWGSSNLTKSLASYITDQMGPFSGGCDTACGEAIAAYLTSKTTAPWCPVTAVSSAAPASSSSLRPSSAAVSSVAPPSSSSRPLSSSVASTASSTANTTAITVPAQIESERFVNAYDTTPENKGSCGSTTQAVDFQPKTAGGGTCDVNWTDPGEWLEYRIKVNATTNFEVWVSLASANTGKTLTVSINGQNLGNVESPATGWTAFQARKVGTRSLNAGEYTVRITVNTGGLNIDHIDFRSLTAGSSSVASSSSAPSQAAIEAGYKTWTETCDTCHGKKGEGVGAFKPLILSGFTQASLTTEIDATMPLGNAGSCDLTCSSNVAAFMLAGYPYPNDEPPLPVDCSNSDVINHANTPIRLVTSDQFIKLVSTVFAPLALDVASLIPDKAFFDDKNANGFVSNTGMTIDDGNLGAVMGVAEAVGKAAGDNFSKLMTCGINATCVDTYIRDYGYLLRRAKLTDTEVNDIKALFTANANATGIADVTTALLLGRTLYMYETNVTARTQLKPRELADRLSTLIWGMPAADKTLLDKAYANGLNTVDALRTEALRMLNDPKAQGGLRAFYDGYLGLDKTLRIEGKDTNPATQTGADFTVTYNNVSSEIMRFASHLTVRTEGTFSDLLLSPKAFVDNKMAAVYGVPASALTNAPTYLNGKEVTLNSSERAGLYTRSGSLALGGGPKVGLSSPSQRGEHFRKIMLCQQPPEAPGDVEFPDLPDPSTKSWVQILKDIHLKDDDNNPNTPNPCVSCHTAFDPIGFAFENYTLNGQYITRYPNGFAIEPEGWFEALEENKDYDAVTFGDALELSEVLAKSDDAAACFGKTWLNYGLARQVVRSYKDHCAAEQLADNFKTKNYSLRELILEVVSNPSFRFRNPE